MLLKDSKGEEILFFFFCSSEADPTSGIQLALMVAVLDHRSQLHVVKESNGQHSIYVNYYHTHDYQNGRMWCASQY